MKSLFAALASVLSAWAQPNVAKQTDVVAAVLWAEARSDGEKGIRAVAEVIRNRTEQPARFGATAYEVVTQYRQFTCLNYIDVKKLVARGKYSSGEDGICWAYAHFIADELMKKTYEGEGRVRGATHFFSGMNLPSWARSMNYVTTVGAHQFYK